MIKIKVAEDFSFTPGARFRKDGNMSGEEFRQRFLEPALNTKEHIIVDFDGSAGYAASFLDEAFGKLVFKYGRNCIKRFTFISTEDLLLPEEIVGYMEDYANEF